MFEPDACMEDDGAGAASALPMPLAIDCCDGGAGFGAFRFDRDDIVALPRHVGHSTALGAELVPVMQCLAGAPAGRFRNLSELYAAIPGGPSVPSARGVAALRNIFLGKVDRRLQDLYRGHLRAHPPAPGARHDEKIAAFAATRAQAAAIVSAHDWLWLAQWLELGEPQAAAQGLLRRLSNFAFAVGRVNFRFTYHCNIRCRHCYNGSGPELKAQRIALEPMLDIVAQMPAAGIGHLNLTGGEPFLYPDHLIALIAAGRAAGLRGISIFTNAYWAATRARTDAMLQRLVAAGFMRGASDFIKVSTGVYHQEFVAFDRVLTLAAAYRAMFGRPLRVDCELAPDAPEAEGRVRQQVAAAALQDGVALMFRKVAPLGRGAALDGIALSPIDVPCRAIDQIVFDPDGSARPCCGMNNENRGVVVGRLDRDTLGTLVKRMQNDPILQFLAANPMRAIFDHVRVPKSAAGYSGTCHLCQHALGRLTRKEELQAALFDKQAYYPFWFALAGVAQNVPMGDDVSDNVD